MGTSVTRTKSATWMVAPPEPGADVGTVIAGYLAAIGEGRAHALVREIAGRTVEAARRALATDADVGAALVAAVLDAVCSAASAQAAPRDGSSGVPAGLRAHLERGAAASASPAMAARWVPRIVGSVEGVVEQCGTDADRVALLVATMALIDVGGGLEARFDCGRHGPELVAAQDAVAGGVASDAAMAGVRALVGANARFDRAVELEAAGDVPGATAELHRARSLFLVAGLRVEAAVTLAEEARLESETPEGTATALVHYGTARAVLVEFDREVEIARADRDLTVGVGRHRGAAAAEGLVDAAARTFGDHDLAEDLVLCDVVRACLARASADTGAVAVHLGRAAERLRALGLDERADRVRAIARGPGSAPE